MRRLNIIAALPILLAGCGLEAVDTTMRARADVGTPEERTLQIADVEFVCPNIVTIDERDFDPKDITERGEVDGRFGPFVPCGATVEVGAGDCSQCKQPYRTPGQSGEAPVATWKMTCPFCHVAVDPAAVSTRGSDPKEPVRFALNQCTNQKCGRYYEVAPVDVLTAVSVAEEMVCPACLKPLDPTLNACATASCRLGGVVRNVDQFEGVCWRCAGHGICPECQGSGGGTLAVYGSTPTDCWACGTAGRCNECEGDGFTTYTGSLPTKFRSHTSGQDAAPLESKDRNWQFPADQGPSEPSGEEPPSDGQ